MIVWEREDRTDDYLAARMEEDAHEPIELAYY